MCESPQEEALCLEIVEVLFGNVNTVCLAGKIVNYIVCIRCCIVAICPHCSVGGVRRVLPVETLGATSGVLKRLLHSVTGAHFIFDDTVAGVPAGGAEIVVSAQGCRVQTGIGCHLDLSGLGKLGFPGEEILSAACEAYESCYCESK